MPDETPNAKESVIVLDQSTAKLGEDVNADIKKSTTNSYHLDFKAPSTPGSYSIAVGFHLYYKDKTKKDLMKQL